VYLRQRTETFTIGNTAYTVIVKERSGASKTALDIVKRLLNGNSKITDSSAGCDPKGEIE
jgi:hypothetical protein